jgi:hypothetical protein
VATNPGELRQVPAPVLIVVDDGDSRGGTAGELAALLPDTRLVRVPGDHYSALGAPDPGLPSRPLTPGRPRWPTGRPASCGAQPGRPAAG